MGSKERWQYGIVLDAGSSGTRLHLYRWLPTELALQNADAGQRNSLPKLETKDKWTKKIHPGVSTFSETPNLVGIEHLAPLVEHASKYVPKEAIPTTPVFLLATAGMRLLPEHQRNALLDGICKYFQTKTDFLVSDCEAQFQVIPGETEGLYGWLAANYLLGGFDSPDQHTHGKDHHTYGFLDMGGASAQIAFAPNSTETVKHASDLTLLRLRNIDGKAEEYKVFVTTWLGFGVHEARRRYVDGLIQAYSSPATAEGDMTMEMPDPCLPNNLLMTTKGDILPSSAASSSAGPYLIGTGMFDECLRRVYPLLEKDVPCLDEPCLLNGVHVPAIDFDVNHFIGISEYWHTTHEIFEMAYKDKAYDFNTYQQRVRDFCEQDWSTIQKGITEKSWGKKVDQQIAFEVCFKASWLISVLHDGIGIPRVGIENTSTGAHNGTKAILESGEEKGYLDAFQAVNKIKSTEISWTLGKMLLYASSDIAAPDGGLPVGFGSNELGIPMDFQFPGGSGMLGQATSNKIDETSQSITDQIHDTIFRSNSSHRIPGFVFFVVILVIGSFYLCGRERRSRYFGVILGPGNKKTRGWGAYVPFWPKQPNINFDRVMEGGHELDEVDSDDTESFPEGQRRAMKLSGRSERPRTLSPGFLDRQGLAIRAASRERLVGVGGRISRMVSPERHT